MSMKNSDDTIRNQTRNLPVCSVTLLQSVRETHLLGGGVVHFEASLAVDLEVLPCGVMSYEK
jgi:hypothetical protein